MRSNLIDLDARLVHQTDKALLMDLGDKEPVWLPKSAVEFNQATGTLTLPEPLAHEKGLI